MVELVYTRDLKSLGHWPWGFDSPHAHQTKTMFDNNSDAYNDYVLHEENCDYLHSHYRTKNNYYLNYNKLFYYCIKHETEKAYLIHFLCMSDPVWVPKCRCRNNNKKENSIFVLKNTKGVITSQTKSVILEWKKKRKDQVVS